MIGGPASLKPIRMASAATVRRLRRLSRQMRLEGEAAHAALQGSTNTALLLAASILAADLRTCEVLS